MNSTMINGPIDEVNDSESESLSEDFSEQLDDPSSNKQSHKVRKYSDKTNRYNGLSEG